MPKPRKPVADYAVYLAVRTLVAGLQAVPTGWARAFAGLLARVAYRVDKRHRLVAADNLRHAFPDASDADIDRLVRGCYRHFCSLLVEIALLPRKLHVTNWRRFATLVDGPAVVGGLLDRRPALIVTAHFGNWELAGFALGAQGFRTHAIARVLDNPHLDRFLNRFRQATGQTIIAKKDDFARLTDVLRAGGKVATLADQDAGPRGVFVDFFGRPASAHKAVALMALEFDARLLVVGVPRVASGMSGMSGIGYAGPTDPIPDTRHTRFEIVCEEVIDPREYAGQPGAVKAITQRYHAALERLIRRHPEQYFWLHRRWKTRPATKAAAAAGGDRRAA